jgi:predicted nucleotidyltransferase
VAVRGRVELVAPSRADDLSLRALADIAELTTDENVRIVGGQMVSLLLTAFPVPGVAPRRTRDADTAITTELAGSGVLHDRHRARSSTTETVPASARRCRTVPGIPRVARSSALFCTRTR